MGRNVLNKKKVVSNAENVNGPLLFNFFLKIIHIYEILYAYVCIIFLFLPFDFGLDEFH